MENNNIFASVEEILAKSAIEFDRRMAESQEEHKKRSEEFDRRMAESQEEHAKFEQEMKKSRMESDKENKALKEFLDEVGKRIDAVSKQIGGMANSNGDYAEEFFYNALFYGQRDLFGEVFDDVVKNNIVTINKGYEDEYDILLVNGRAICVVEVKYKADSADLPQRVLRKAQTFRVNFPQHKNKKLYLALASMSFHKLTEKACKDNGIAIMKQVGDTMVVSDENIKTF